MAINMATLPELDPTEGRRMRALGQDLGQNDLTNHWAASIRGKGDERGWGVAGRADRGGRRNTAFSTVWADASFSRSAAHSAQVR